MIRKVATKIFLSINIFFVILLLMSTFSGFVSPATALGHIFYISTLLFPIFIIINFCFFIYWGLRSNPNFTYSLVALILAFVVVNHYFRFNPFATPKHSASSKVKLLTFNIQGSKYLSNKKKERTKLYEFLNNSNSDIICLQELYLDRRPNNVFNLESAKNALSNYKYVFFEPNVDGLTVYGNLIASKYPLNNIRYFKFKNSSNSAMLVDVSYGKRKFLLINAHLESNRLEPIKQDLYGELSNKSKQEIKTEVKGLLKQLVDAADRRATQVDAIDRIVRDSKIPVILCGDFNDPPASYAYRKFNYLGDAFCEGGEAFGATYNGKYPSFRIDYILYDKKYEAQNYQKHKINISDHFPISAEIIIK